jgi:CBS domain-containing protein
MPSVKDLMTKNVITIDLKKSVFDAAVLMSEKLIGCLVINLPLETTVSEIMSQPLITIDPDASLREAARLMLNNKVRRLPVVKENKLVGIIVIADFARQLSKKTITEQILEAMARYPTSIYDETLSVIGEV